MHRRARVSPHCRIFIVVGYCLILGVIIALPQPASAQALVTDRPDFTESAVSVAPQHVQFEGGYTFGRTGDVETQTIGEFLIRLGLIERVEARIGVNSYAVTEMGELDSDGFQDASLGFKVRICELTSNTPLRPAVALLVASTVPTGATAFTSDEMSPEAKLCLGWNLTESVGLGANLNAASVPSGDDRFAQFSASLSLATSLSDKFGAYAEWYGFVQEDQYGPNTNFLNSGVTVLLNNDTQLDGRVGFGMNAASPEYFVGVGVSRRMGL